MLRDMFAHERQERQEHQKIRCQQDNLYSGLLTSYFKILGVGGTALIVFLLYARPKFLFRHTTERLPTQHILTLYPPGLNIQEALPRFFQHYALVSPDNLKERLAVQRVHSLRKMVTNPGGHNQKSPWVLWNIAILHYK
jgi:hypothetical protein